MGFVHGLLAALVLHAAAWAAPPDLAACDAAHDASHQRVLQPVQPALASLPATAAWLNQRLLRWGQLPSVAEGVQVRLLHSAQGRISATVGQRASGADAALLLQPHTQALPATLAEKWRWFPQGAVLAVAEADVPRLQQLLRGQLVLVLQDAQGRVLQATGVQHAAALDDLYSRAATEPALGASVQRRRGAVHSAFKLWAPTAQAVWLCLHPDGVAPATALQPLRRDARTGIWLIPSCRVT